MRHLIDNELVEKYLRTDVVIKKKAYKLIFQYTGNVVGDTHEVEVGFETEKEKTTGFLYLPSVREDGLLQRNKTLWYEVYMLIPPVKFTNYPGNPGMVGFTTNIVNTDRSASKLADFFPSITQTLSSYSPMVKELYSKQPKDIQNLWNWNAIDLQHAIVEMANVKLVADIIRSGRGGSPGVNGTIRAIHTLLRAFTRYHGHDEDDETVQYCDSEEEVDLLGNIAAADKQGVIILHEIAKEIDIRADSPIDFCTCSQTYPIVTGRLKDGVTVDNCRLSGKVSFPYTRWRRAIVGIKNDDPHRVIVSKAITRALRLHEPDEPLAITEVELAVDSLSMPGVRMTHPLNYEDGLIVSKSFAEKAGGFKVYVDQNLLPDSVQLIPHRQLIGDMLEWDELKDLTRMACTKEDLPEWIQKSMVYPGDIIGHYQYRNLQGTIEIEEMAADVRAPSLLLDIDTFPAATDMIEPSTQYRIVYMTFIPLEVGDKIADAHGNKATVSAILPDDEMPVWSDGKLSVTAHYIATPYCMKRLAVGGEIEDKIALLAYVTHDEGTSLLIDSDDDLSMNKVDAWLSNHDVSYTGDVDFKENSYTDIPLSMRRMFRLDNNAGETLNVRSGVVLENGRRKSRNIRLGVDIVTMISRRAGVLVNDIVESSMVREQIHQHIMPIVHAAMGEVPQGALTFDITEKLDRALLGNPFSGDYLLQNNLSFVDTVADPRIVDHYGIIRNGKENIIVPPMQPVMSLGTGRYQINAIAVEANKVIAEIRSRDSNPAYTTRVPEKIYWYHEWLKSRLTGKSGLLRKVLFPVMPHSIRAVTTPSVTEDPLHVKIPARSFFKLCEKDEKFKDRYYDRIKSGKPVQCIVKRDPVHREHNLITVSFSLWNNNTIGISPLLIGSMDGDYDGDTISVLFPVSWQGCADMRKLNPDMKEIFSPSKQLYDAEYDIANYLLKTRIGWTSTFRKPHESDILANPELFTMLMNGDSQKLAEETVKAARDFEKIKDGTAFGGAMGITYIFTRNAEQAERLSAAMETYHLVAQNTLDAKAGAPTPAIDLVDAIRTNAKVNIQRALDGLSVTDPLVYNELEELSNSYSEAKGRMNYLVREYPLLATTQRNCPTKAVDIIWERLNSGEMTGHGTWEVLFDYLLGRTESSPFEWVERLEVFDRMLKEGMAAGIDPVSLIEEDA